MIWTDTLKNLIDPAVVTLIMRLVFPTVDRALKRSIARPPNHVGGVVIECQAS
jgi:hypothetical protein